MIRIIYDLKKSLLGSIGLMFMSLIMCLLLLPSCTKPPIEPVDPCEINPCDTSKLMGKLDTLWAVHVRNDNESIFNYGLINFDQHIIVNYSSIESSGLSFINKSNPDQKIQFDKPGLDAITSKDLDSTSRTILIQREAWNARISYPDGQLLAENKFTQGWSGSTYGYLLGPFYYRTRRTENDSEAYVIRSLKDDLMNWDTIYTLTRGHATGGSRPNIQSFNLWINPASGDSILIFQHRMAFPNRVDVVAYNLNQKEIEWNHDNLTSTGNSNHQQILVHENNAFFGGAKSYYCFDLLTGQIKWQYEHPEGVTPFALFQSTINPHNNSVIVKDGLDGLFSFEISTGSILWYNKEAGNSTGSYNTAPRYHNDIIYYHADASLCAVRASTGKLLWKERPFKNGSQLFYGDIVIDPERGVLYATDRKHLYCIKLYPN